MCKRICNKCGSENHTEQYGMRGTTWYCDNCPNILEFQFDIEWSPIFPTYEEAEKYAKERSYINSPAIND